MAKKQKEKKSKKAKSKEIVISQISLLPQQVQTLQQKTPSLFIKERVIRGGKKAKYIEVGYVVSQLNQIFGAPNWEFEVLEQGETSRKVGSSEGEVWVKGKLSVIDHKNGYRVSKTQYGQHSIYTGNPIGDAFKAATSDALKKCATMFGIGLDVYWNQLDDIDSRQSKTNADKAELSPEQKFEIAKKFILSCKNDGQLVVLDEKIKDSKIYNKTQKEELRKLINTQVDQINANANA